jgi:hypothetical protein
MVTLALAPVGLVHSRYSRVNRFSGTVTQKAPLRVTDLPPALRIRCQSEPSRTPVLFNVYVYSNRATPLCLCTRKGTVLLAECHKGSKPFHPAQSSSSPPQSLRATTALPTFLRRILLARPSWMGLPGTSFAQIIQQQVELPSSYSTDAVLGLINQLITICAFTN